MSGPLLCFGLGELKPQHIPCNIGPEVFATNPGLSLDHRAKFSRHLPLTAQDLADKLRAACNRCSERGATALEVDRALNGFVHDHRR